VAHRLSDHTEQELFRSELGQYLICVDLSPDGSQLAFGLVDVTARTLTAMTMPAAGGPPKPFATLATTENARTSWTRDGRSLVFTVFNADAKGRLLFDVTTGVVTPVSLAADGDVREIAVSPDGTAIAYVVRSNPDRSVWMLENFLPKPTAPAPKK
jgi:Tol biopolymer transport system component